MRVTVVGAGLAGCEAAWQLAQAGIEVVLCEMKPKKLSLAHHSPQFAELVCSNSLKASRPGSAAGMLKQEMRWMNSLILACAEQCAVGAGGALAVDRDQFSGLVTRKIKSCKNITVVETEMDHIPDGDTIIATGPLTSDKFADCIFQKLGERRLSFYDAAAPIIAADSIDLEKAFFASRYGRGDADYINCPMQKQEYENFYFELIHGEIAKLHEFDQPAVYEGCMPIEVMAKRGKDTIRFGPLRPVGIRHPVTNENYYAVLQLRRENAQGTMYNMVGFQTNLKFSEQKRIFSMIPGLEKAEFVRYGVMHRNTFIDSPRLLDCYFRLKQQPRLRFAGQITGVEGYMESAASGLWAGYCLKEELFGRLVSPLPRTTMLGALAAYISDENIQDFQPMGANMGLLPSLDVEIKGKQQRYEALAKRGLQDLQNLLLKSVR